MPFPVKIISDSTSNANEAYEPPESSKKRNDEFYPAWRCFLAVEPKRESLASRNEAIDKTPEDGLQIRENASRSWLEASNACRSRVEAIVKECERLNQKYHDVTFDLEANAYDCLGSLTGLSDDIANDPPPWVKRVEDIFDNPQFFIDGASASDVNQGAGGDCWFLASLMAVTAKQELIENLCVARNPKVGVYGFVFYRDGEWIHEIIDDKLFLQVGDDDNLTVVRDWDVIEEAERRVTDVDDKLKATLQKGGAALFFSHCKSDETWLPLLEKAYAKAHGDYQSIEGGHVSEGIEDLTGGVAIVFNPEDIMDKDRFWREQLRQVNKTYLFGGSSKLVKSKNIESKHAYGVLDTWEEGELKLLKLKNPWGHSEWIGDWSDGSKFWTAEMMTKLQHTFDDDGIFWMTYQDFLKHFPRIYRARLFDNTWKVRQQWTAVEVPWTPCYLDASFTFTSSVKGPVVVVLAKPDDRYFRGIEGRFSHDLHFRVYREGDNSHWIVRSMHDSGNSNLSARSVSAEIEDLEPGTYRVVFKVTAYRWSHLSTAEERIAKNAVNNQQKLLDAGRRCEYAQTKGNLQGLEEAVRRRERLMEKEKKKEAFKKARWAHQQERRRARLRKKRWENAEEKRRSAFQPEQSKIRREDQSIDRQQSPTETTAEKTTLEPDKELAKSLNITSIPLAAGSNTTIDQTESQNTSAVSSKLDEIQTMLGQIGEKTETLSARLAQVELQRSSEAEGQTSMVEYDGGSAIDPNAANNEELDVSLLDPSEELRDEDFDWDSDLDGPVDVEYSDAEETSSRKPSELEVDPWNALCVVGLRVYSQDKDMKIAVHGDAPDLKII